MGTGLPSAPIRLTLRAGLWYSEADSMAGLTGHFVKAKKKKAVRFALILTAGVVLASAYIFLIRRDMTDFGVCYQGGERIIQGETLYREADGHLQFKYSPAAALFFTPLSLLPYEAAKAVWFILELAFLAGIIHLADRMLPAAGKRGPWIIALTLLIELKFLGRELELGQVNLLILFILTLMLYSLIHGKEDRAGLLWGGSLFFKPYALVFLPYLLLKRRFRTLLTGAGMVVAGLLLPAIFYGLRGDVAVFQEWSASLSKSTAPLLASYDNASLYGFLLKTFPALSLEIGRAVLLAVFLALALAVLWMMRAGRASPAIQNPEILEAAFLLVLIPVFSPLGWNYNYLYSILAVILLLSAWQHFSPAGQALLGLNFVLIGTSLIELWGRSLFRFYTRQALVVLNFLVVLAFLAYLRARRRA